MKQVEHFFSLEERTEPRWRELGSDTLLALVGVALVTAVIEVTHLYPRIPTISYAYLLVVLALASTRGRFSAILASVLAFLAYLFFFVPPLYTFLIPRFEDLLTLVIFLSTAVITGQLAAALRLRAEQAHSRERELRILYEQAQQLAALQERQRLARELHDSVSQALYGISLGIQTAIELQEHDPQQATASLEYAIALTEAGLAEMRALIFELRPESLETEGLVAALVKQIAVLRTRYRLTVEADLAEEPSLSLEKKNALYRIAQEACHNIVKHARASTVTLRLSEQEDAVLLEVLDDGRGFDPTRSFPGHLGLRSMQERTAKVEGTIAIESVPDHGTCIRVHVPRD